MTTTNNNNEGSTMNTDTNTPSKNDAMHIDQIESAIYDALYEHCKATEIPDDIADDLIKAAVSKVDAHYNELCNRRTWYIHHTR